jgi:hypothetical protein
MAWPPDVTGGRGWRWPPRIAVGDVIEFGVDQWLKRRKIVSSRWWGVIADYDGSGSSVQGPYPSPAHAHVAAGNLIQERHQPAPNPPDLASVSGPLRDLTMHRGRVRTHPG